MAEDLNEQLVDNMRNKAFAVQIFEATDSARVTQLIKC